MNKNGQVLDWKWVKNCPKLKKKLWRTITKPELILIQWTLKNDRKSDSWQKLDSEETALSTFLFLSSLSHLFLPTHRLLSWASWGHCGSCVAAVCPLLLLLTRAVLLCYCSDVWTKASSGFELWNNNYI